ncbi:MAG: T9SS type A sorting domain-containing protein [Lentisphaeria bacterium]|nr:T9SS type A sorting domain-containing protein [Candidatus Neomarinimicrobiota bacterium]MCF7842714.1 T9SS type A sorting domain-containing protein [Lentisphaeria bacterium]
MSIITRFFLLLLFILAINLQATTYTVSTDSTGDFTSVQTAINQAVSGDTILIEPGTYYENINFSGKNLVVGSRYLLTQDNTYIGSTILDGNQNGRVVTFENNESRAAQLVGLTIQHGTGTVIPDGGIQWAGGGILVGFSTAPTLSACTIKNNTLGGPGAGAGIASLGSPNLSGLSIHDNVSHYYSGGLNFRTDFNIEFDPINRCSIYNNYSGVGNDIYAVVSHSIDPPYNTLNIPLDTGSVAYRDRHFIDVPQFFQVTVNHGMLNPVPHDLYVSPAGNDSNTGLSPDAPLKTIQYALALIQADSANPRTVHLLPGRYTPSGGQIFPLNIRDYVNLAGSGRDTTILDNEYTHPSMLMARYDQHYKVSCMKVTHAGEYVRSPAFYVVEPTGNIAAHYDDMIFEDNDAAIFSTLSYSWGLHDSTWANQTSLKLTNMEILNNKNRVGDLLDTRDILVENVQVKSVLPQLYQPDNEYQAIGFSTSVMVSPGTRTFKNVQITGINNPITHVDKPVSAMSIWRGGYAPEVRIINCTIADNTSIDGCAISMGESYLTIVNSIIWGNVPRQLWFTDYGNPEAPTILTVKNSIFQGGQWEGLGGYGSLDLHWLDGNLDQDPLFTGDTVNPYTLSANSPAIDGGTDFFVYEGDTLVNLSPDEYSGVAPDMGAYEYTGPVSTVPEGKVPEDFTLSAPYPNPFNPITHIDFQLARKSQVSLVIYDVTGRVVAHLIDDDTLEKGPHQRTWNASGYGSGVYFVRLKTPEGLERTQKVVVLK